MNVTKIFSQLELERGHRNEERALEVIISAKLNWVHSARLATKEEDSRGIDIVLETDIGQLFFQIKSSYYGMKKFIDKHGNSRTRIAIIILNRFLIEESFQRKVLEAVNCERNAILAMREQVQEDSF